MYCPQCYSDKIVKNGHIHNGKPKFKCKNCGRQFVENPVNRHISDSTKQIIDKRLLEKISLLEIYRVVEVSKTWLHDYIKNKYHKTPNQLLVKPKKNNLIVQMDELGSFVDDKKNKQWVWLAMDVATKEIVGFHVGARVLWDCLPPVYK